MDYANDADLAALAQSDTVATFVPGANYFLGLSRYPDARRLIASVSYTHLNKDLVDAWKKLRHPKAHGEKVTEDSGWNLYCSAVELLHRIVAHAIGYDGPVLMTSQRGWGLDVHQNRGLRAGKPTQ